LQTYEKNNEFANRKIFCSHLPYTNHIQTIQGERRIGEDLAKYKRLIIGQKPEKYTDLKLWHIYCAFF